MARRHVLGTLRGWSIASLACGMTILCLLGLFFPALRDMVPPPSPPEPPTGPPAASPTPSTTPSTTPAVGPSTSSTSVPGPQTSGPPGGNGHAARPGPPGVADPNPPPAPGDKQ